MPSASVTRTVSRLAGAVIALLAGACVAVAVGLAIATIDALVVGHRGPVVTAVLAVGLLLFLIAPATAVQQARLLRRRRATPDRLLQSAVSVMSVGAITTLVGFGLVIVVTPPL